MRLRLIFKVFFELLLVIILLGYWLSSPANAANKKFKVVTTFTVIQDMTQNIAGEVAIVESVTKPGADIHEYDVTPKDIVRAQSADLILYNGLGLERWFNRFFDNMSDVPVVIVSAGIIPLPIRQGPYTNKPNPHAWMSTQNALIYVDNIRQALVTYDPNHAEIYNINAERYSEKIRALDAPLRQRINQIPQDQRWLVTSEGAFSYLVKDYQFKEAYLWPINAEEQGAPQQVRAVIDIVRQYSIPVVFSESTVSDKPARQVAKETGARYGGVLYVDSISAADGPVPSYLDLLNVTIDTIAKGFENAQ